MKRRVVSRFFNEPTFLFPFRIFSLFPFEREEEEDWKIGGERREGERKRRWQGQKGEVARSSATRDMQILCN